VEALSVLCALLIARFAQLEPMLVRSDRLSLLFDSESTRRRRCGVVIQRRKQLRWWWRRESTLSMEHALVRRKREHTGHWKRPIPRPQAVNICTTRAQGNSQPSGVNLELNVASMNFQISPQQLIRRESDAGGAGAAHSGAERDRPAADAGGAQEGGAHGRSPRQAARH